METENSTLTNSDNLKKVYFAGGCFWCMEGIFESQEGVKEAIAGYAGGTLEDATYEKVSTGKTAHREAVEVIYDPSRITFATLVDLYYTQIDPTQTDGQFADRGYQYTTAIYYQDDIEKQVIDRAKNLLESSKKYDMPIAVETVSFTTFYRAEEYHQDYYRKSAFQYNLYKKGSGRKAYIDHMTRFDTLKQENLKQKLTDTQYRVTQEKGTESPFQNAYWNHHEAGIYVDIVDGIPLFSSLDKFDSGTGWPSFARPIDASTIDSESDTSLPIERTELVSKKAHSHLGHLFDDGPISTGGMRYCINSAALRFVPVADLDREGYGEYLPLFSPKNINSQGL